ncbi:MAG: death-on-curing family protein [Frankiales bacterium]|nr:death-on-curing family protein [Frankiales bacterium]
MIRYLEVEDVQQIMDRLGGRTPGVRDPGLLVSALARPRAHFEGAEVYPSLALKAAALLISLASLESLTSNNLRVAWVATRVFCVANGAPLVGPEEQAVDAVRAAAVGAITLEALAELLAAWMTPPVEP